jgi:hypothetical protein
MSQSGVLNRGVYPPGTVVTKLSPSAGTIPVVPDFANNINLFSGNNITTTGTGANTIGFSLTGTTNHCIQIGNVTGSLTSLAAATDGQIPIGSTGLDPVIATITAGTNITITNGPGSITISGSTSPILDYVSVDFPASPYTALVSNLFVSCDLTGGPITILLPNAPTVGEYWIVKDRLGLSNTNNITVTTVGGVVLLDGATTFVINLAYGSNQFIFNGTSYEVF